MTYKDLAVEILAGFLFQRKGIAMKWIPFCIAASIVAFAETSISRVIVSLVFCLIAFFYALHFDNQIMKFLSWCGTYIVAENKRREKEGK